MSIDEIIKALERFNRIYSASVMGLPDAQQCENIVALREAVAKLRTHQDNQPNEPRGNGWISVDDKDNPPPEGKKVIAYLRLSNGDICETAYYMGEDGWYYTGWEAPHHGVVTHWRPLPEPPKEDEL